MKILNYDGKWEEQTLIFENLDENEKLKKYPFGKFGELYIVYENDDEEVIKRLDDVWDSLGPKLELSLTKLIKSYDRLGHLKVKFFQAYAFLPEKEVFNGVSANIFLSFSLLETPTWNFWLKNDEIIHSQASF